MRSPEFYAEVPDPKKESFEQAKARVWKEARQEVLGQLCTPGKDDDACVKEFGDKFDVIFERIITADPKFVDKWVTQRDYYFNQILGEVRGESDPEVLNQAA